MERTPKNAATISTNRKQRPNAKIWILVFLVICIAASVGFYFYEKRKAIDGLSVQYADSAAVELYGDYSADFYTRWLPINEYRTLDLNYQDAMIKFLVENDHGKDGYYFLTRIPARAKKVICFGNFANRTNSDDLDIAFLVEYYDFTTSRLVIMDKGGNLLFTKNLASLPIINSFKKGAKIYKDKYVLEASDTDGIIVKDEHNKYAIVYDKNTQLFQSYYQHTEAEIKAYNNPSSGSYEEIGDEPDDDSLESNAR